MAYSPPVITAAGLTVPSYNDIQTVLINAYKAVYGSTVYLGNDSADYQWISNLALKLNDNCGLCQLAYNARSPLTAIGADLDSIVKINGIARLPAEPSTATLYLTGLPGVTLTNALVQDVNGVQWALPTTVIMNSSGSATVTATCQQGGEISAAANTINIPVGGFTAGWNTVTNPSEANVGTGVEADSALRARQAQSVSLPSSTRLAGTTAEVEAVPGVTLTNIMENQGSVPDQYGNLSHSMTAVVQGGDDLAIATAIFNNRGIGCNTLGANPAIPAYDPAGTPPVNYGLVEVPVTDPNSGAQMTIGFVRPQTVPVYVAMNIHPLTTNYNSAMQTNIQNAVAAYLNSLKIGEEVTQSALYGAALSVMSSLTLPDFSIRALYLDINPSPTATNDLILDFWQVSSGDPANVTITPV